MLRWMLKTAGLRQRVLAKLLGKDTHTVNRWCSGHTEVPRYAVAFMVAYLALAPDRRAVLDAEIDNLMRQSDGDGPWMT
jgi:transcriptional regulator with XRE-family HTH domain